MALGLSLREEGVDLGLGACLDRRVERELEEERVDRRDGLCIVLHRLGDLCKPKIEREKRTNRISSTAVNRERSPLERVLRLRALQRGAVLDERRRERGERRAFCL